MKLQELLCRHKQTYKAISNDKEWEAEETICLNCGKILEIGISKYQRDIIEKQIEDFAESHYKLYMDFYYPTSFGIFKTTKKV